MSKHGINDQIKEKLERDWIGLAGGPSAIQSLRNKLTRSTSFKPKIFTLHRKGSIHPMFFLKKEPTLKNELLRVGVSPKDYDKVLLLKFGLDQNELSLNRIVFRKKSLDESIQSVLEIVEE